MTVSPSLGKFSAGARVTIKNLADLTLGSGTTTSAGTAAINIGSHTGAIVIIVTGAADGSTLYFDENAPTIPRAFLATHTLRAIAPAVQATIGVTAATNAAIRAIELNNGGIIPPAILASAIRQANTKIATALGITDILQAPKLVDSSTSTTLDISNIADKYALQLAAIAQLAGSSGKTALDVANDLANDLADDHLDGKTGTGTIAEAPIASPAYTAATVVADMSTNLIAASITFGTSNTAALIAADPSIAGTVTTDVTAIVPPPAGTNAADLQLAKNMFAELRTTVKSLTNNSKSGFMDLQAKRAADDVAANVAPALDSVMNRLAAVGMAASVYDAAQTYQTYGTWTGGLMLGSGNVYRQEGSLADVWYRNGFLRLCRVDVTITTSSPVTCFIAGTQSADYANNLVRFVRIVLTPTGTANQYTYTADRYDGTVTSANFYSVSVDTPVAVSGVPTGSGAFSSMASAVTLNGTFPPSTALTGRDTVAISAARTQLSGNNYRYAMSGSVSTINSSDSAKTVSLSLDTGSLVDVDETTPSNMKMQGATLITSLQTAATKATGKFTLGSFVTGVNAQNVPSDITFEGSLSDLSTGGAGEILTGKFQVTIANMASYNELLPDSSSNYQKTAVVFNGTLKAPERPVMNLVISASRPTFNTNALALNYTYGTVSLTGSGTSSPTGTTMTLTNQNGIQVSADAATPGKDLITKSGATLGMMENGSVRYVDGVTESAM